MKHKVPPLFNNGLRNQTWIETWTISLYHSSQVSKSPNFPEKTDRNLRSGKRTPLRTTKKHHSCLKTGNYDVFCKPHTSLYTLYISIIERPTQRPIKHTYQAFFQKQSRQKNWEVQSEVQQVEDKAVQLILTINKGTKADIAYSNPKSTRKYKGTFFTS